VAGERRLFRAGKFLDDDFHGISFRGVRLANS
jgi:hypothetical protein